MTLADGRTEDAGFSGISGGQSPEMVLREVTESLFREGYHPVRQLAGYLLSGEPAHITSSQGARALIIRMERETLLEFLVERYMQDVQRGD